MKKINPKVIKITIALMSVLLAGGAAVAVKEVLGEPTAEPNSGEGAGNGFV